MNVAFMQNMWVKNPDRVAASIEKHARQYGAKAAEAYRHRLIATFLFMGCVTGRRLGAAFGAMTQTLLWEESTRQIAGDPKTVFPPDLEHISKVLEEQQPAVVITFGNIATEAVQQRWHGPIIICCHPAARPPDTIANLAAAAAEYRKYASPVKTLEA